MFCHAQPLEVRPPDVPTGDAGTPLTAKWQIIELDEAQGIGSVEIEDGFTLRHEISFHFGDESEFKARQ